MMIIIKYNHNTPQFLEAQDCWLQVIDLKIVFVLFVCFHSLVFDLKLQCDLQ